VITTCFSTSRLAIALGISLIFLSNPSTAQSASATGSIAAPDSVTVSVVSAFPEEFPNVSVVFRALSQTGKPVFGLQKQDMRVFEGTQQSCEVIRLVPLSDEKSVNLGIVLDHSGSMIFDPSTAIYEDGSPRFFQDQDGTIYMDPDYTPPMEYAKAAVIDFMRGFDTEKDYLSVIGFSAEVDVVEPLTKDTDRLIAAVSAMKADFSTALYDAMLTAINEISDADGIRVLVVLTDGNDNASSGTVEDVINMAQGESVPIYLIGLGEVNVPLLESISASSGGRFYYTESAGALGEIYDEIRSDIQSFYDLVYTSPNLASSDDTREFTLSFEVDYLFVTPGEGAYRLPADVVTYLESKERERQYTLYGGIALVLVLSAGVLLYTFRRRKDDEPKIVKVYPNPATDRFTIEVSTTDADVLLFNASGVEVSRTDLRTASLTLDVAHLPRGTYVVVLETDKARSKGVKVVLG